MIAINEALDERIQKHKSHTHTPIHVNGTKKARTHCENEAADAASGKYKSS